MKPSPPCSPTEPIFHGKEVRAAWFRNARHRIRCCALPGIGSQCQSYVGAPLVDARNANQCSQCKHRPQYPALPGIVIHIIHCPTTTIHGDHSVRCMAMDDNAGDHKVRPDDRCRAMDGNGRQCPQCPALPHHDDNVCIHAWPCMR